MNFYPFHVGDYTLRTAHLDPMEDLAYRRLLDLYYVNESPLTGDAASIARLIRMRAHVDDVAVVLEEFFNSTSDGWRHSHCDEVIQQYQAKARQAAENGKKGGRPRKGPAPAPSPKSASPETKPVKPEGSEQTILDKPDKPEITQPVNSANPDESGSKTNHEPLTSNQLKPNPLTPADAEEVADAPASESKNPRKKFNPLNARPENISVDAWEEWCQYRREIRKPLTATMCKRQAATLADHHNPDAVLRQSIGNGWTGLFPEKIQPAAGNVHPFPGKARSTEHEDHDNDLAWMEQLRK